MLAHSTPPVGGRPRGRVLVKLYWACQSTDIREQGLAPTNKRANPLPP